MGKATGFMEYERLQPEDAEPAQRIKNYEEFHLHLTKEQQMQQGARCMDCGVPFCQSGMMIKGMASGCPLNNLVPEWNDLIYHGKWQLALQRLLKTNNFPEFTARVCPSPCEAACTCGLNNDPVTIKENEFSIIENGFASGYIKPHPPGIRSGKKVAVIGSGPSGLAAADQLNKRGHSVMVYERYDRAGGLLRYGIPNMKLEKNVIDRRIKLMQEEGTGFIMNADVGTGDFKAEAIINEYDAVVLACGASNPRDIQVPGREAGGIYFAVDFLRATTQSLLDSGLEDKKYISAEGKNVLIIGGGDTGNDCVGTSIRHGCTSVTQLEMMPRPPVTRAADNAWPEWPKMLKVDYGQQEAINQFGEDPRIYQTTVKEFLKDKDGNVSGVVTVKLQSTEENGRMVMKPVEGSEITLKAELVLIAAGFLGSQPYISESFGVDLNPRTNILTEPGRFQSSVSKIFAAGDVHRGQSLVVWAIREGRDAARAVDRYLMGYTNL